MYMGSSCCSAASNTAAPVTNVELAQHELGAVHNMYAYSSGLGYSKVVC